MAEIHPTALVEEGAQLGAGCIVGPFCVVGPQAVLGERVELKSHVVIAGDTTIGDETVVFSFAVIGEIPQDLKFRGEHSRLVIGRRNRIREHVTMNPGTDGGGGVTRIGDDCLFMAGAHVAHDCQIGDRVIMVNNAGNLRDRTLLKMTDEELDSVLTVHVKGTFWCTQAAARAMVEQGSGGAVVNTTSGAHFGSFGQTAYAAAKGAIASMTYTWAMELARHGIRVNAIGPLGTTAMSKTYRDADGNPGQEFDPAMNGPALVYLCSDEASNVSGQVFGTGGQRLSHMVQPHYGKTLVKQDGWDIEAIRQHFQTHMPGEFGAFGILGQPYPFHGGVKAPGAQ